MCGIIGYIGEENGIELVFKGLIRLEYRGYDSVGIGFKASEGLKIVKSVGRIESIPGEPEIPSFERKIRSEDGSFKYSSHIVIGHTRWATHGVPSEKNAHPHLSQTGKFAIVHNGIIENYSTLRNRLQEKGFRFVSDTDSEVIAHLIEYFYNGDLVDAVKKTLSKLEGAYSFLVISTDSDEIIGAKMGSSMCLGIDQNGFFISSDESPFVDRTNKVIYLDDGNLVILNRKGYSIQTFEGVNIEKEIEEVPYDLESISKAGYPHFMLKEIHEQPQTIQNAFRSRIDHLDTMLLENFPRLPRNINNIIYLGCGTSYYAAMIGAQITEQSCGIRSLAENASEFLSRERTVFPNDVYIAISQSGETADTKNALENVKEKGAYVAGMVNVVGSSIARIAGKGMYLHAGPEIGVASTKAFTSQLIALNLFATMLSADPLQKNKVTEDMKKLPSLAEKTIQETEPVIQKIAPEISKYKSMMYLGKGVNFPVALEGALKMKEIAYIHAEGYSSGELKHGPIALIDENLLTVFIITGSTHEKALNNLKEIKARKGRVLVITDDPDKIQAELSERDFLLIVPRTQEQLSPILNVIPLQLLAYYVAKELGRDIDKPRNLAKSVTVE